MSTELRCKVIELNRSRNNVVLSRRAVLEDERKEQRQQILDRLNPGDVVEGTISNIVDFGAFVDLDGMDGLIHISELSWSHVNHPSEVLEIGQEVKVKVLDIDRDRQRISLGLKQTQSDPWQQVIESYSEGDVVEGRVTKVVTFGAFVEILPGVEGLVHISELAQHHVENPREVVSQGDAVNVLILEVDAERRRLSLSLKRVEEGQEPLPRADGGESVHLTPNLNLSEDVFPAGAAGTDADEAPPVEAAAAEEAPEAAAEAEPEAAAEPEAEPSGCGGGAEAEAEPDAEAERRGGRARGGCRAGGRCRGHAGARVGRRCRGRARGRVDRRRRGGVRRRARDSRRRLSPGRAAADRGRHHRRHRRGQERGAVRVPEGGRRDGVERRDRPPSPRAPTPTSSRRSWRSSARTCSTPTARSIAPASPRTSSPTGRSSTSSKRSCTRAWPQSISPGASGSASCRAAGGRVTEVPLLYETGGDERFDKVVVITAPAKLREQRRRVTRDDRDERLLPDKEKVKRADFAYVNTGTLEELDAWVAGVMRELTGEARDARRDRRPPRRVRAVRLRDRAGAGTSASATRSATSRSSPATPRTTSSSRSSSPP